MQNLITRGFLFVTKVCGYNGVSSVRLRVGKLAMKNWNKEVYMYATPSFKVNNDGQKIIVDVFLKVV